MQESLAKLRQPPATQRAETTLPQVRGRAHALRPATTRQPRARSFHGYDHLYECEEAVRRVLLVDERTPVMIA